MNDWPEITVEDACCRIIDYRGKTPKKAASGIRLVTAKVVKGGRINEEPAEFLAEDYYDEWMRRGLPELHDTVLTTEAPLGEVGLIRTSGKIGLGQRIILLRPDPAKMDKRFLHLVLQSDLVQNRLQARATGTTVLGIKQSELRRVELPCPPLETQRRIAAILGAYDDLIEVNRRRVAVLEEMARGLFEEWFVRFRFPGHEDVPVVDTPDGPLPEGWEWSRFSHLAVEVRDTLHPSSVPSDTPYLGLEHFPRRSTTLADRGAAEDVDSLKSQFRRGDILFGKIRPYFHKVIWAPFDGIASTDAIVWRPDPRFAARALQVASSDAFVAHSVQTSNGTKMPRANPSVLASYPCVMPDAYVGQQFESLVMPMIELAASLQQASERLASSRDLLLPRLISGQLSVEAAERKLENAA